MRHDLIAKARKRLKEKDSKRYSLRSIATRMGVSHQLIHLVENGDVRPSVTTLISLCRELGLDINQVLADEIKPIRSGRAEVI